MEINIDTKCLVLGDLPSSEMPKRFNAYPYLVEALTGLLREIDYCVEDGTLDPVTTTKRTAYARAILQTLNA